MLEAARYNTMEGAKRQKGASWKKREKIWQNSNTG